MIKKLGAVMKSEGTEMYDSSLINYQLLLFKNSFKEWNQ